ncbi:MAG TPA: fumarylacetoacetate hydrolase family protein [Candidatus Limnocylindrales bacterium]|jgi:2-keto-4-pentenoate hydratase/2-oxohepta-3-ene-1,7-dioic acid hydratase in catechol pathway|nr:fumarylacetoacetate hydrolase family protein [Candidatus Limnocylindrales bacterium]
MKLAAIKPNELAIVKNETLISIGELLPKGSTMIDLITAYDGIKGKLDALAAGGTGVGLDAKRLKPPVENPSKIWAAAGNYKRGTAGLGDARGRGTAAKTSPEELLENIFLKPPSAIAGPEDNILIPKNAESIFPELELCVVIGKKARHVSKARAFDVVFGYTIMLDVTARGYGLSKNLSGTRNVRKGFETFAPIGPWITTKDEIAEPHNLWMKLWINGELKQSAKTDAMINDIATQISFLSEVTTLLPGDLLTTGNPDSPEFQEKLKPGDVLKSEIEGIGAMNLGVARQQ